MTACARSTAPAASSPLECLSWREPGGVSARPDDGVRAAVRSPLDNGGAALTPPFSQGGGDELDPRLKKRRQAWALRDAAAMLLRPEDPEKRGPSVCACGRTGHEIESVGVHRSAGGAWTSGTLRCNSGWLCPVCAPRRARERQERVAEVYDAVTMGLKGQIPMVTLTVQHRRGMALADLREVVQAAWRSVRQGTPWARQKKRHQVLGTITAPEVTYGRDGWHFHLHIAIPCVTSSEGGLELGSWIIDRYLRYIRAAGYQALSAGQDVTLPNSPEDAARYLSKGVTTSQDISWELAGAANKRGKNGGGLHPFDILEAASGDASMAALWREYASAMKGARSCVISASLAERLGLDEADDVEDPTVVEETADLVGTMPAIVWNAVMRKRRGSTILSIVEDGGAEAWPHALSEAYRIADLDRPDADQPATPPPPREHAPSPEYIADLTIAESYRCRGRKGIALKKVLDRERGLAVARGVHFVPPEMRRVLELLH